MADLAVVLISKNQEWNISRLVESVLSETAVFNSIEIVLVDSASTDRTIEIAKQYPIKIVSLSPNQRLTAALGRYVGLKNTSGEFVLFLDGDMKLFKGWIEKAMAVLKKRPDVAIVTGELIEVPIGESNSVVKDVNLDNYEDLCINVLHCGGASLFKRSIFKHVGTFNPHVFSDEEPELCLRIRHADYLICKIGFPIAYHYSDPPKRFATLVGRWKRNLYLGHGQNLRHHLKDDLLWPYIRERGHGLIPGLGFFIGIVSLGWFAITGQSIWFSLWLSLLLTIICIDAIRKRSFYRTFASLLERIFIVDGTIRGFLIKPMKPDESPVKFEIIKHQ